MNFGEKLEYLMKEKGVTRAELSRATNIAYTTIDSILKRNEFEKLKLPMVQAFADYFNTTIDYLIRDEINDPNYGKEETPATITMAQLEEWGILKENSESEIYVLHKGDGQKIQSYPPEAVKEIEEFIKYIKHKYNIK